MPGAILPIRLADLGGTLICQKDSFLAAAKGVSIGIHFQRKMLTGLFGGEGFIMQKLEGDGWVFVQMGGTVIERELRAGEELHVDTGCIAAFTPSVDFDLVGAGGVKSALFGGEGLFFARLHRARARSGSSRCPSPAWPAACCRRRCPPAAAIAARARPGPLGGFLQGNS